MAVTVRIALALMLVGVGWGVATVQGQRTMPTFELEVDSPGGRTTVRCLRGCSLMWVERGISPSAPPQPEFTFDCTGPRCSSARVGGWVLP